MATYIMLMNLTTEGRRRMSRVPDTLMVAQKDIDVPGARLNGTYATLGQYDFVGVLEAPDNDAAARFSLEMGARAGLTITTLPAIPIGRFESSLLQEDSLGEYDETPLPEGTAPGYESAPS